MTMRLRGYFDYVVPPLGVLVARRCGQVDYANKDSFRWISVIRLLPDFVKKEDFDWAVSEAFGEEEAGFFKSRVFHL